jgi:hypothetical protein
MKVMSPPVGLRMCCPSPGPTAIPFALASIEILAAVLIVVGLLVVEGTAGTIILACGFLALLAAGIRLISTNDPAPREKGRVSAGHPGV